MSSITSAEIEATLTTIHRELTDARWAIRERAQAGLVGRTITIIRGEHEILATVVRLRWRHDDDVTMMVTYPDPATGETVEDEEWM